MTASLAYATFVAFTVWVTLCMFAPRGLGHGLAALFSFVGMIASFFLLQGLALGGVIVLLAWRVGAFYTPLGQVALAAHAVCAIVTVRYVVLIQRARPVLDGVEIADDAQPFSADLAEPDRVALAPAHVSWRPAVSLRTPAMAKVHVSRNVIYREVDGVRLRLDVYRPFDGEGPLPAAVYIHGGGWVAGDRRQSQFMMYELAAAGWAVFAISYRLAPRFPLPAPIEDCKAAIAWVREHADAFDVRRDCVVVIGGSAGGHLAAMVALSAHEPSFQPGFEQADTRVQGAVVLYGIADFEQEFAKGNLHVMAQLLERYVVKSRHAEFPTRFRAWQPVTYVTRDAPPVLLVHGRADQVVPFAQSERLESVLREAGVRVHLLAVPHGQHAFEVFPSPLHQRAVRVIERFMQSIARGAGGDG